jgi:hypothetical protein
VPARHRPFRSDRPTRTTVCEIWGKAGSDTLNGTAFGDLIFGLAGNDSLSGGGGPDTLNGGAGLDTLAGGTGNDGYIVDATKDTITDAGGSDDRAHGFVSIDLTDPFQRHRACDSAALARRPPAMTAATC